MRIERMRIRLPARFRADAAGTARAIAEAVAGQVGQTPEPPARVSVALDGGGRPSPLLASAAGEAAARATGGRSWR